MPEVSEGLVQFTLKEFVDVHVEGVGVRPVGLPGIEESYLNVNRDVHELVNPELSLVCTRR